MAKMRKGSAAAKAWGRMMARLRGGSRRRKRNPVGAFPLGGVALNPPRKHHRRRKHNPPSTAIGGGSRMFGFSVPSAGSVLAAGVGFAAPPIIEHYLLSPTSFLVTQFPNLATSTVGKYVVRAGSVLGLTALARRFAGPRTAAIVGLAGFAYIALAAVREFAPGLIPGLSAYTPIANSGMQAYTPIAGGLGRRRTLGAATWGAVNSTGSAPRGGSMIVAERFRRFA